MSVFAKEIGQELARYSIPSVERELTQGKSERGDALLYLGDGWHISISRGQYARLFRVVPTGKVSKFKTRTSVAGITRDAREYVKEEFQRLSW